MLIKNNIQLRIPEPDDIEFILSMENNSELWHVSNTHTPFSRFDIEQYVLLSDKDVYSAKQIRFLIDCTDHTPNPTVGIIDIFDFDAHNKRAGIGISIIKKERDKGFAGISLDIVINYLFSHLNIHQVYCNIEDDNTNSIKLFESRGFVNSGIKKDWNLKNQQWVNELFFQLIK